MSVEMNTEEAIIANAEHHSKLLKTIADLEYVPSAKTQQSSYLGDLETQLMDCNRRIEVYAQRTAKERKEHEALRDSTGKRLAHRLIGKREQYEAKESKEEREYVEALEREMSERAVHKATEQLIEEARVVLGDLKDKNTIYESAQAELQALYHRVFDGPSESFPEDDKLEYDLDEVIKQHQKILEQMNVECRATELLARASREMDNCQKSMQEALGYSRYDMWGGGTMTDLLERNALASAQTYASQVEMLVDQAMRMSPAVQPVGRVNIAKGSIVSDVLFDNFFTDLNFHNKIKQSAAQVLIANQRLKAERDAARRRAESIGSQLNYSANKLDHCRQELANFRRATFESYAAQNPPPPSYDIVASEPRAPLVPPSPAPLAMSPPPPFPVTKTDPTTTGNAICSLGSAPSTSLAPGPVGWGNRNPYASAMSEQTSKLSDD
ncbi:hypothetical protein HYPSUDRAFT_65266 [Hypholoma sublateritium FD-334 SS-4]|uniref:Uncharacterized protein n=1 Tax=Hypholoma sublateritium (strain FD-334 SS-4) TaxID=945553 RepID=A0A0D2LCG8_HYPSF|nr:hypothetical protein HYPSUDRAFT_65266 [Hypholoma sublateritium FD-334 SS-4]